MWLSFAKVNVDNYVDLLWILSNAQYYQKASEKTPSLYALVIGINEYINPLWVKLSGAVADADHFQQYLTVDLNVPLTQIRSLRNTQATRAAIIQEFTAFTTDARIQNGDPIVIYYAGHGGTAISPKGWEAGGPEIQMLIPHDCQPDKDDNGVWFGVPDRTVGALLERIADAKGDNITVILDCCHSGSGTRDQRSRIVRGVGKITRPVPPDLDQKIWDRPGHSRGSKISAGFLRSGLRSHTLLAACTPEEDAKELQSGGAGEFTTGFLRTIRRLGADMISYTELIQRMDALDKQNPQCEGENQHRIIFNAKAPSPGRDLYLVHMKDSKIVMDAGLAQGITDGSEFSVYGDRDLTPNTPILGKLIVLEADAYFSEMGVPQGESSFTVPEPAYALQTKAGVEEDLLVHVQTNEKLAAVSQALIGEMQRKGAQRRRIMPADKDKAHWDIGIEGNAVVFNSLDPLVTQFGLSRIPNTVPPNVDDVRPVLRAMAHYHWHMKRANNKHKDSSLFENVTLEFLKVRQNKGQFYEGGMPVIEPYTGENLIKDGVVNLEVDEDDKYGFKLTSRLEVDIYPYLFFFDNSDLSITSYYQPPSAKTTVYPPLKKKESLTIGYGAGGGVPRSYFLNDGQDVDVGFLKLFLTTDYVDLSKVPQGTPFSKAGRGQKESEIERLITWEAILIPVVQRRKA